MLKSCYKIGIKEAGCDEAGRGCLSGPVYAAAVVLPARYKHPLLNDSKQIMEPRRYELREEIEEKAVDWAVGVVTVEEIDEINILNASFLAMHRAVEGLKKVPAHLLIDGNRFNPYPGIPHTCIIGGDGLYFSIAAASILAKTYRDDFMKELHEDFPQYLWDRNKGYATRAHREAIKEYGATKWHRKSFNLFDKQLELEF
ncbi:MAG TPA: ribonuclease HII [Bacteroidales bacterium]|nr:ribonuclease HII [Bacteroidales bacterium]